MDPTLNALAHKIRFEMAAEESPHQANTSQRGKRIRHQLGTLLVIAGEKLQANEMNLRAQPVCEADTILEC